MGWTQPMCGPCWRAFCLGTRGEIHEPTVVVDADPEVCCACGTLTVEGVFVRVDPTKVPFPREERDG